MGADEVIVSIIVGGTLWLCWGVLTIIATFDRLSSTPVFWLGWIIVTGIYWTMVSSELDSYNRYTDRLRARLSLRAHHPPIVHPVVPEEYPYATADDLGNRRMSSAHSWDPLGLVLGLGTLLPIRRSKRRQ